MMCTIFTKKSVIKTPGDRTDTNTHAITTKYTKIQQKAVKIPLVSENNSVPAGKLLSSEWSFATDV